MEPLGKIFGSWHRVKIMRLFLFNNHDVFDIDNVITRSRIQRVHVRKELNLLTNIGFLKKKTFFKKIIEKTQKKKVSRELKTVKKQGWILNQQFELIQPLYTLLLGSEFINEKDIMRRLKKSGSLKLLILSGLFIRDDNRKLDILIVGNRLKKETLEKEISIIESEIGRELSYSFFDEKEFHYRLSMYDRLIRDILENDHIPLVKKISY